MSEKPEVGFVFLGLEKLSLPEYPGEIDGCTIVPVRPEHLHSTILAKVPTEILPELQELVNGSSFEITITDVFSSVSERLSEKAGHKVVAVGCAFTSPELGKIRVSLLENTKGVFRGENPTEGHVSVAKLHFQGEYNEEAQELVGKYVNLLQKVVLGKTFPIKQVGFGGRGLDTNFVQLK